MYLFAPVAFVMKVTALHLWSIFTPKSGANAKEREERMHFGVAQRFAALIAGAKQTSLKVRAEASAGLLCRAKGHVAFWRRSGCRGWRLSTPQRRWCWGWSRNVGGSCYVPCAVRSFAFGELARIKALADLWRGMVSERGGFVLCTARRAFICFRGAGAHRGACVLCPSVR